MMLCAFWSVVKAALNLHLEHLSIPSLCDPPVVPAAIVVPCVCIVSGSVHSPLHIMHSLISCSFKSAYEVCIGTATKRAPAAMT